MRQIILPNIVSDVNFRVPKMDRCRTCHLAIDKAGYEKHPQPFYASNLDNYLGGGATAWARSAHAACHEGMGQSVSFRDAYADRRETEEEWEKKYHWEEPHLRDYPMLPIRDDGSVVCECHKQRSTCRTPQSRSRLRDHHERTGCMLPQDQGLRGRDRRQRGHEKAGADPNEVRFEADARLGEDLDPQSAGGQAGDLDAAHLVQLELQLAGGRDSQRGRDQRGGHLPVCQRREA